MKRTDDVIELGTASIETKGSVGPGLDEIQLRKAAGIADD